MRGWVIKLQDRDQLSPHGHTRTRTHRARIIGVCLCLRLMLSAFSPHQCLHNGRPLVLCEDRRTSPAFICSTPTASYFQRTAIHATVGFTKLLTSALRHHGCYSRPVLDVIRKVLPKLFTMSVTQKHNGSKELTEFLLWKSPPSKRC